MENEIMTKFRNGVRLPMSHQIWSNPMKSIAILTLGLLLPALRVTGQGSLVYQNTLGAGKERYVFKFDPSAPTIARNGGRLSDYDAFLKVDGTGYYAELWWAPGESQPQDCLKPVPGSIVTFRTGNTAGLINGKAKLEIPGTLGGDIVTLQLRVWNNQGQTVTSWEKAIERGRSNLFNHELSGVDATGAPKLGTGSIAHGLQYFCTPIPEPSVCSLLSLALGVAFGVSEHSRRRSASHETRRR